MDSGSRPAPLILINRASGGTAADEEQVMAKVASALKTAGIGGTAEWIAGCLIASRTAAAVADGTGLIIIGGGDGSVGAAAGAVAGTSSALGILPLGTLNHLARDLGIPFDLGQAAAVIAAGRRARIDVARLNGRVFVNNSAIGLYPLFVADREGQRRLGRSKRLAMSVAGLRTLARFHHHRLTLTVNDRHSATIETPLLFVGNNDYRLDLGGAGQRDSISGGQLSVIALRRMGRVAFFAALVRALTGRSRPGDMIKLADVRTLKVASRRSLLTVSSDGETFHLAPPLDFRIDPGALNVIVPAG